MADENKGTAATAETPAPKAPPTDPIHLSDEELEADDGDEAPGGEEGEGEAEGEEGEGDEGTDEEVDPEEEPGDETEDDDDDDDGSGGQEQDAPKPEPKPESAPAAPSAEQTPEQKKAIQIEKENAPNRAITEATTKIAELDKIQRQLSEGLKELAQEDPEALYDRKEQLKQVAASKEQLQRFARARKREIVVDRHIENYPEINEDLEEILREEGHDAHTIAVFMSDPYAAESTTTLIQMGKRAKERRRLKTLERENQSLRAQLKGRSTKSVLKKVDKVLRQNPTIPAQRVRPAKQRERNVDPSKLSDDDLERTFPTKQKGPNSWLNPG